MNSGLRGSTSAKGHMEENVSASQILKGLDKDGSAFKAGADKITDLNNVGSLNKLKIRDEILPCVQHGQ